MIQYEIWSGRINAVEPSEVTIAVVATAVSTTVAVKVPSVKMEAMVVLATGGGRRKVGLHVAEKYK